MKLSIIALFLCVPVFAQNPPSSAKLTEIPLHKVLFEEGQPLAGVGAIRAMRLPFACTSDGTVFIDAVHPLGSGRRPDNLAPNWPATVLISINRSGKAHSFLIDQVPNLYFVSEMDHYATESRVVFLLRAAKGDRPAPASEGNASSVPELHSYVAVFDREGDYKRTVRLDDAFEPYGLGLFPSGNFLAYGYDTTYHSPKLAILKDDGSILEYLQLAKGATPQSVLGTLNNSGKGDALYIAPLQVVEGRRHSILLLQSKRDFPILEVSESGEIRQIYPKLPNNEQIEMLIPSDANLYARPKGVDNLIYELDYETGIVLNRFEVNGQSGSNVACLNENRFLSFKAVKDNMVPLVGTAAK